jgi:membrane protein DedA with SNARE-associated domain
MIGWFERLAEPWIYAVVFLAAASEAALFIGLAFPGETVLLVAGFLAWKGVVDVYATIGAAVIGAIAGDSFGYELGRHFGPALRHSTLGRRLGDSRWQRAEDYLRHRGAKAVFIGRFVTGLKAIVPPLSGQARMPYRKFLVANVTGALLWGIFHVGVGYLVGPSYRTVERYFRLGGVAVLALLIIAAFAFWWWRRRSDR